MTVKKKYSIIPPFVRQNSAICGKCDSIIETVKFDVWDVRVKPLTASEFHEMPSDNIILYQ
jgi:hypothetical protein